jgi:hypothetical protein
MPARGIARRIPKLIIGDRVAAAWAPFDADTAATPPPVVTTSTIGSAAGQILPAARLFSVSDPNG